MNTLTASRTNSGTPIVDVCFFFYNFLVAFAYTWVPSESERAFDEYEYSRSFEYAALTLHGEVFARKILP